MKQNITKKIARIENRFIFNARYQLSAREQKIILYLMSNLDPKQQEDFHKQVVPVKELESLLKASDKKWGGLYKEMNDFSVRIISKYISFDSDFLVGGKPLKGVISWFQSVIPVENEHGEVSLEFMFSERLKPFLLQLSEYAKIHPLDVAPMKSGFAIRMYQVFKAERDRMRKHTQSSTLVYTLDELKNMLGIGGKYKVLKDFRRRVLDVVEREVNTHSPSVQVKYEYIKSNRRVTGVKFLIFDKAKSKTQPAIGGETNQYAPSEKEVEALSYAKHKAYETLVKFGVFEGIAYKQIVPNIKGGEVEGFEDYFVKHALAHFKRWARNQPNKAIGAATFVSWWTEKKVFDQENDVFWKIVEKINQDKKKLDQITFDNRMEAKKMTKKEFIDWYKGTQKKML